MNSEEYAIWHRAEDKPGYEEFRAFSLKDIIQWFKDSHKSVIGRKPTVDSIEALSEDWEVVVKAPRARHSWTIFRVA